MTDLPVACTLTLAALKARREGLLSALLRRAEAHEELPEGCRLRFAAGDDVLLTIAQMIDAERKGCRFLRFNVVVEPDGGPVVVELTGPPGTREFVSALLDS
jgi:hypothetical protein